MKITRTIFFIAVAAAAFPLPGLAAENVLLALNAPARETLKGGLTVSATAQINAPDSGYTDFDALSAVNDPLYREGARELLKQVSNKSSAPAGKKVPVMRDAPNSKPVSLIKKPRVKKNIPVDPLKVKNTL